MPSSIGRQHGLIIRGLLRTLAKRDGTTLPTIAFFSGRRQPWGKLAAGDRHCVVGFARFPAEANWATVLVATADAHLFQLDCFACRTNAPFAALSRTRKKETG